MEEELMMAVLCLTLVFCGEVLIPLYQDQDFFVLLGDDHGGKAVVGRRDADWAHGNSTVTNILLVSTVRVVGAVFANRNALALGGILNQQEVGYSTINWVVSMTSQCNNTCRKLRVSAFQRY
jgi:hypothetical protein